MNREILQQAAKRGIINHKQADELLAFIDSYDAEVAATGEEQLRFVRNFGDIFITLGILFVTFSIAAMSLSQWFWLLPTAGYLLVSEWLVRVRRLALPGIALLLSTLYFLSKALGISGFDSAALQFLTLSGCSLLYYLRYRMPFSLLPVAAGLVAAIVSMIGVDMLEHQQLFTLFGIGVFIAAMSFDIRDRTRQHRASDCAFWLHLLASPLIVHGVMTTILFENLFTDSWLNTGMTRELLLLLFFVVFMLTALLVDRRAMLVSSLSYAIYAIFQLVQSGPLDAQNLPLYVFIGFGIFIVFFGTYWYKLRSVLFKPLADTPIARFVPPF